MKRRSGLFYVADARTYLSPRHHLRLIAHVTCTVRGVTAGAARPLMCHDLPVKLRRVKTSHRCLLGEKTSACRSVSDGGTRSLSSASLCRTSQRACLQIRFICVACADLFSSRTRSRRRCMLMFFVIQTFSACTGAYIQCVVMRKGSL